MSAQVALSLLRWREWAAARSAGRPCRRGYSARRSTYVAGVEQRIQRGHAAMPNPECRVTLR